MINGFHLRSLSLRYGPHAVLHDVSLHLPPAQWTALAGPNGAGKSSLLATLAALRLHHTGTCLYNERPVNSWPRRTFARAVAFVPQSLPIEFPFTAEQIVLMGRTPHGDGYFDSPADRAAAHAALDRTDALPLASRPFQTLSGGERQRVILAAALAQAPQALLLDEPTTFLDLSHQLSLARLLRSLREEGLLIVTVTHDLNLAATFCDRLVLLREGRVAADGLPADVLTPRQIEAVFDVHAHIHSGPTGRPWLTYAP